MQGGTVQVFVRAKSCADLCKRGLYTCNICVTDAEILQFIANLWEK